MKQGSDSPPREPAAQPAQSSAWAGADAGLDRGLRVLSYLLSGVIVYGLLGWLGDHLLGTAFLLPVGIVAGAAMGIYVIIRRYGSPTEAHVPRRRRLVRPSQAYALRRFSR